MQPKLRLTLETLTEELLTGAFAPMTKQDRQGYLDAPPHSVIATIKRGNHTYQVTFDCVACEFEITLWTDNLDSFCWVIDTVTNEAREL